jgi:hypothetical protein
MSTKSIMAKLRCILSSEHSCSDQNARLRFSHCSTPGAAMVAIDDNGDTALIIACRSAEVWTRTVHVDISNPERQYPNNAAGARGLVRGLVRGIGHIWRSNPSSDDKTSKFVFTYG